MASLLPRWLLCPLALLAIMPLSVYGEEDNRHRVEVIVFTQNDSFGVEGSAKDPELRYGSPQIILTGGTSLYPAVSPTASYLERLGTLMIPPKFLTRERARSPENFVPLEKAQRQLNPDAYTLERSASYQVLFHEAWEQPLTSAKNSTWVVIAGGKKIGDHHELEGSLRVFQSRFVHAETFLWLSQFAPRVPLTAPDASGQETVPVPPTVTLPEPPSLPIDPNLGFLKAIQRSALLMDASVEQTIPLPTEEPGFEVVNIDVLKTSEQVRRGTLHYIDHPRFGVLVLVTPIESDEDTEDLEPDVNFE